MLGRLQDQDPGALAQHEPVPALVERPGGPLGLVVAGGQRPHLREPGHRQPVHDGLGATGDHHVRPAEPDQVAGQRDRLGAARAGADRGVHPGPGAELQSQRGARPVRHEHRHGQRGHPAHAALPQDVVLRQHGDRAADAAAHDDREPFGVDTLDGLVRDAVLALVDRRETGVGPRLPTRDQRGLLAPVQPARLDPLQHGGRLDRHPGDDPGREVSGPLVGEGPDPGASREQSLPGRRHVATERGGGPEPGDDDRGPRAHAEALAFAM